MDDHRRLEDKKGLTSLKNAFTCDADAISTKANAAIRSTITQLQHCVLDWISELQRRKSDGGCRLTIGAT